MDQLLLALRVAVSLAIVIGMIWALSKVTRRWNPTRSAAIQVVSKVSLSKRSSLIVVGVGDRGMLLGVTDHGITQLGEVALPSKSAPVEPQRSSVVVDLYDASRGREPRFEDYLAADLAAELDPEAYLEGYVLPGSETPKAKKSRGRSRGPQGRQGQPAQPQQKKDALAGSVLSPDTWRQAMAAIRDKTVRS
jgi:flagellar biosynthetic protein FliO